VAVDTDHVVKNRDNSAEVVVGARAAGDKNNSDGRVHERKDITKRG
jgi:hypothetical protein